MKRMLIINLGGIGDFLLSTPAVKALRDTEGVSNIDVLVTPGIEDIARDMTCIDGVHTLDLRYGGISSFGGKLTSLLTLLKLRNKRFDMAVNMRTLVSAGGARKIEKLLKIIAPVRTAGRDTEGLGRFFDIKVQETREGGKYEMEYDIDTAKALGAEVADRTIEFNIGSEDTDKAAGILAEEGVRAEDVLIGIHPGGMPSRRWPLEGFHKVIDGLAGEMTCKFIVTGGKDETDLAEALQAVTGTEMINLAGRLTVKGTGAVIKRCGLYISNDTGPMHIAAILKTPLVAIFGPGDITRFDPRNISDRTEVLYKRADCAPCEMPECDDMKCLEEISARDVLDASLRLLKETR